MPSFAFIIIATELQPWKRILVQGPESTWIQNLITNEHYLAIYSDGSYGHAYQDPSDHRRIKFPEGASHSWEISQPQFIRPNHAVFNAFEGYGGLIPATVSAIEYIKNTYDPDFYIRTNVSSYWNTTALKKRLSQLPSEGIYAGVTGPAYSGLTGKFKNSRYVSGAGMVLSRDVASKLVDIRKSIDLTYIDDLSIGRSLTKTNIVPTELTRIDLRHASEIDEIDYTKLNEAIHFRCKSEDRIGFASFRSDVALMKAVHKKLNQQ